jgi:hypothetical protein
VHRHDFTFEVRLDDETSAGPPNRSLACCFTSCTDGGDAIWLQRVARFLAARFPQREVTSRFTPAGRRGGETAAATFCIARSGNVTRGDFPSWFSRDATPLFPQLRGAFVRSCGARCGPEQWHTACTISNAEVEPMIRKTIRVLMMLSIPFAVSSCFFGTDDDDDPDCDTECDDTHSSCVVDCDSENTCIVGCDSDRDECRLDCD